MSASALPDAIGDAVPRPVDATASVAAPTGMQRARPTRLLVALHGERSPQRALRFVDSLAAALGAELHVLRVVPPAKREPIMSELATALRDAQRVLASARRTRALCDGVLSRPLPSLHVCVRIGGFVEQVTQRAAELDASLIGLPATNTPLAAMAILLAREADRPVIITRGHPSFQRLLAATDLEDRHVPLLRRAAQLGDELAAPVIAIHGVLVGAGRDTDIASINGSRNKLEDMTRAFDTPLERVVVRSRDLARCILEQARVKRASLILVGVRPHVVRTHPSTAEKVLRRARGPVLVVPLGPAPRAASRID